MAAAFFVAALTASPTFAQEAADAIAPEFGDQRGENRLVTASDFMVSTAHPQATKAGIEVLAAGGNAIDAMVAVQLVLGLVEPQSSGIGGGAFLLYHDAQQNRLTTYDGRETAPAAATPDLFMKEDGEAMGFFDAVIGGRSVGTPGTLALLFSTHAERGSLPWDTLVAPAIGLARDGFEVSPRLNASIARNAESLFSNEKARAYFFSEEGVPIFPGTVITNVEYADTLEAIADSGGEAFYTGDIAQDIVRTVQQHPDNPGLLSLDDLMNYEVKEREPVCFDYRNYEICGMGPPSSGALTMGQIFGMLENFDLAALGPRNPESWRLIGEASRLAFADRGRYMADSDFVEMPDGLLNRTYLEQRANLFGSAAQALDKTIVQPGNPPDDRTFLYADDTSLELPSTSHFSIVDAQGNVVSMTTTIENAFGSRQMVRGFLLNNELTDFSFTPQIAGRDIANRVEGGKRPRSSMSPTIVYRDGRPFIAIGSPGGSRIIGYVTKTLIAMLDWGMDAQSAIDLPHLVNRFGTYDLEEGTVAESFGPALSKLGYRVEVRNLNSGLHTIAITEDGLLGAADPRREGVAAGQ